VALFGRINSSYNEEKFFALERGKFSGYPNSPIEMAGSLCQPKTALFKECVSLKSAVLYP